MRIHLFVLCANLGSHVGMILVAVSCLGIDQVSSFKELIKSSLPGIAATGNQEAGNNKGTALMG